MTKGGYFQRRLLCRVVAPQSRSSECHRSYAASQQAKLPLGVANRPAPLDARLQRTGSGHRGPNPSVGQASQTCVTQSQTFRCGNTFAQSFIHSSLPVVRVTPRHRPKKASTGWRQRRQSGRAVGGHASSQKSIRRPCGGPSPCGRPDERALPTCGGCCRSARVRPASVSPCGPAALSFSQSLP